MKLQHVLIRNFKGIRELEIDFAGSAGQDLRQLTTLIGDNGSGKTTALQAIALTLSMATRRTRSPADFNWHGFLPERLSTLGRTEVRLQLRFDADEVETTSRLFREWRESTDPVWRSGHRIVPPGEYPVVSLSYAAGRLSSPQGEEGIYQFRGRYYVRILSKTQPDKRAMYPRVGDTFWFDQHRNLGSILTDVGGEAEERSLPAHGWQAGVEQLRQFLVTWWAYHTSSNKSFGKDYIPALEERFASLFPGTRFSGVAPRGDVSMPRAGDSYFFLERDGRVYDLAEMSSGEQAVFPLVYEFVRLDIARSIVLIDELELHLHPPQQQALLAALRRLGRDCQFLITTHSRDLEEVIPEEEKVRMEGGRRCL